MTERKLARVLRALETRANRRNARHQLRRIAAGEL